MNRGLKSETEPENPINKDIVNIKIYREEWI